MIVENYTQFAKKTFLLGLDKRFFYLYAMVIMGLSAVCLLFDINLIYIIVISAISYIYYFIKFAKDPYWFEKRNIQKTIHKKYKFYAKTKHILPR